MNSQQRAAMQMARDALWTCREHNKLHHGYSHNTTITADEAIVAIDKALAQPKKPDECASGCPERTICDYCTAQPQDHSEQHLNMVQGDPVAYVTGTYGGRFVVDPVNRAMVLPVGMAFYTTPPSVEAAIEATKEKAAKVCESKVNVAEDWDSSYWDAACDTCAAAIRSMK